MVFSTEYLISDEILDLLCIDSVTWRKLKLGTKSSRF